MAMTHSPAQILRAYLVSLSKVNELTGDWPSYISTHPDEPDQSICFMDVEPVKQGRIMRTGEVIRQLRVMVHIRSKTFSPGWTKANEISDALDTLLRQTVVIGGSSYKIHSVSSIQGVNSLGTEPGTTKRRELFSLNVQPSIRET